LLEAGKAVHIGSRALDLLISLVERPGELLSKDELISRAWPNTHVVEGNLKFQVSALRRALRDGQEGRRYLETTPGRGYRFVADVEGAVATSPVPASPPTTTHNLPARLTPLIGRDDLVAKLERQLAAKRLITIVGPGGIGKSSVAMATAERLVGAYADGVWSVDLARLNDPTLLVGAVAAAVHSNLNPEDPLKSLVEVLGSTRMLLVFDDCSHMIDAVARLVVAIVKTATGVHVLATSREPLRVEGEHIYHLGSLESPPASESLTSSEALRFPAVQLFVSRAAASDEGFELRDEDAPLIGAICRKLDGIPLAIELAATRVDVLGVRGVAARLEQGLQVLAGGRREALPRHRTMRATLDWSYSLLSPPEQTVLSRLAVFAGGFALPAAAAVVSDADLGEEEVVELVLELATKSLLAADERSPEPRFRLLATTRAYAIEKAKEHGELDTLARRHAAYFVKLFEAVSRVDAEFDKASDALALEIDNLRAALAWAFAPQGDRALGIGLTAASVPLWLLRSLMGEWHAWAERALQSLDETGLRGTRQETMIRAGLGISFQLVRNRAPEAHAALTGALELAGELHDADYQLRILHTLWIYHMRMGEVPAALALYHRAEAIAALLANPISSVTAESMRSIALVWTGEHESARRRLESLLQELTADPRRHFLNRAGWDLYVVARYLLARILWIQGYPDRAMNALEESIEEARRLQHPQSMCSAFAFGGCALALQMGDLDMAERLAAELVGTARRYAMEDFHTWGKAAQEVIALRSGHGSPGPEQLRLAIQRWRASGWHILLTSSDLAEALLKAGIGDEISAIIDEELDRAERDQMLSIVPELLRIRGELLLLHDTPNPALARECFLRSLDRARAHGALSWELRAALSLTRLERSQGPPREANQLLRAVYDRFTEGFDTSDLKRARHLLDG
jgi:predicted ATPase/DNA-binding winged helix-turn-helix (wHTH) protein